MRGREESSALKTDNQGKERGRPAAARLWVGGAQAMRISKSFTLRLVWRVRLTHQGHQAQIAVLDASLCTHFVRPRTLPVWAPQTPLGANPPASSIFSQP